jgi:hypothetical protein
MDRADFFTLARQQLRDEKSAEEKEDGNAEDSDEAEIVTPRVNKPVDRREISSGG